MTQATQTVYTNDGTPVAAAPLLDANGNPILSPTGQPILAPVGFNLDAFAQAVGSNPLNYLQFKTGGEYDLQRNNLGVPYSSAGASESFVSAFTALASYALGYAAAQNGIPLIEIEIGGGINNLYQWSRNPNVNISGFLGNNPANVPNIQAGYAAAGSQSLGNFDGSSLPPPQCFASGTPILFADNTTKPIESIAPGDHVLAFDPRDPRGALKPARVTRIFRNVSEEWLVLDSGLTVTPGHRFLNERGAFERIDAILARGGRIIGADGATQAATAERVVYSEATRGLYEEGEAFVAASSGALALQPEIKRGWRTYNFEVEDLHTYVAGAIRVHNDSLGDLIVAENDFAQINGFSYENTQADAQLLVSEMQSGQIPEGAFASSFAPNGDTSAVVQRIMNDDDTIANTAANAAGDTVFTDSYGDQIVLDPNRQVVSETLQDGQGGSVTQNFGTSSNGTQYVASEQDVNGSGQVLANIVNTIDPTTGALQSSSETDYSSTGSVSDAFVTDANGNIVAYHQFNADGSSDALTYNSAGEAVSETTYAPDGSVVQQQNFSYDSSGNLTEVDTSNGAGVLVNTEVYNADGSSVSTDFNAAGEAASDVRYAPDGSVTQQQSFAYDSSGALTTIDTYDPAGNLLSVEQFASDGSTTVTQFSGGQPVSLTVTTPASTLSYDAGEIAASLSSTIGNLLSQNGSIFDKIAADTISGDIGTALQQLLTMSSSYTVSLVQVGAGDVSPFDNAVSETFANLGEDLPSSFATGADLGLSSVLTAEAAQALGISGFAGVAFSTIGGTITQQLVHNAEALVLEAADVSLPGFTGVTSLTQDFNFASLPTQIGGAFGSYFGSLVLPPTGLDGEIGGALGSSVGSTIGTAILPVIGTFIGSFLGDILGTLFGDLFSRPPQATDQVEIDPSSGLAFRTGGTSVSGASASMFYPLADAVVGEVNQVLSLASATFTQSYASVNYQFKHGRMTDNSVVFAGSRDSQSQLQSEYINEADRDSLYLIENGVMQSSDVIALAGLGFALAQDSDVASVASDEQTAKDYETYLNNTEAVNALIAAAPNSVYAAGWAITLMRAEELGLTNDVYDAPGAVATLQTSGASQEIIDIYSDSTRSQLEEEIVLGPNGARQDYDYYMNQTLTASGKSVTTLPGETLTILGNDDTASAVAQTTINLEGANDVAQIAGEGVTVSASGTSDQVNVADNISGLTVSGTPAQIDFGSGDSATITGSPTAIALGAGDSVDASGVSASAATTVTVAGRDARITISGATINVESGASVIVHGSNDVINVALGGEATSDASNSSVTLAQGGEAVVLGDGTQVFGLVGGGSVAFAAPQGVGETTYSLGEVGGVSGLFETTETNSTASDGGVLSQQTTQVLSLGALSAPGAGVAVVAGPQWGGGTIQGVAGQEEIDASGWSNTIAANGGSGVINAGQGQASVNAGGGDVIVNLDGYNNSVSGGDGADFVTGSQGDSTVSLGNGEDTVIAGGFYNSITLGNGSDVVQAGQGNETIALGDGADSVDVAGYYNMITAGDGADAINAGQGNETISLGNGNDGVTASGYSNKITLGGGNDTIAAGDGNEIVSAGSGSDSVTMQGFSNLITLGDGADTVSGGAGSETIKLGNGNDTINVAGYNNAINVGDGNDTLNAGAGGETIVAGDGDNTINASGYNNRITVGNGDNTIEAGAGSETITTGSGSNAITAQGYNDQVTLGAGALDNVVTMSNGALAMGAGAAATLTGDDNAIALSSNDTIAAQGANETYTLGLGFGQSEIAASSGANSGTVQFGAGISDENLWFVQDGNALKVGLVGYQDELTIDDWFGGANPAAAQSFATQDGLKLDAQVGQLIQAMAAYGAANPAFNPATATQMPNDPTLQSAIAAAWHS